MDKPGKLAILASTLTMVLVGCMGKPSATSRAGLPSERAGSIPVVGASQPVPTSHAGRGSIAARYRIVRREMELTVYPSLIDASLDIEDTLEQVDRGSSLAQLTYDIARVGPLFRFVVIGRQSGHGWSRGITNEKVSQALDVFTRWHQGEDVSALAETLGEWYNVSYPADIAVVVSNANNRFTVQVTGEAPAVQVRYSLGMTGRALVERSLPGIPEPKLRTFIRFEVPNLQVEPGVQSRLKTFLVKSWAEVSVVALESGGTAVDFAPGLETGAFAVEADTGLLIGVPESQRTLGTVKLSVVFPEPKQQQPNFVDAAIDAPQSWGRRLAPLLRALGSSHGVYLRTTYVADSPPVQTPGLSEPLHLPEHRGKVEDLLRLAMDGDTATPLVVFTDRPQQHAALISRLRPKRVFHLVQVPSDTPTGWQRLLGNQSRDAALVEKRGGMWIELTSGGEPLSTLWEHLAVPRWIDDLSLTVDGMPVAPEDYLVSLFTSSAGGQHQAMPSSALLGTSMSAVLLQPKPAARETHWKLSGSVWGKPMKWEAQANGGSICGCNLRDSGALQRLTPDMKMAVEASLAQCDVFPNVSHAWISPVPWRTKAQINENGKPQPAANP